MTEVPTFDVEEIFGDADARQAHRYRLAWMSARQRAANHLAALVDSDDQPWLVDDDLADSAEKALLASVGFTETDYKVPGYFDRKRAAEALVGIEIESHCSGDYPMYVLTAKTFTASRGTCLVPDFTVDPAWNEKLAHALKVLDLKPTQAEPCWLLASYWG